MAHLKVINFGAIKSADIEIKKYNFFYRSYIKWKEYNCKAYRNIQQFYILGYQRRKL